MSSPTLPTPSRSWWQRNGPIVTLLLLSPVMSELLSGSTKLSTIFVLIPATGVWGCAALLIREWIRRRGHRWSLVLLGVALAVAEECVIQQTSLAPLIGVPPDHAYARWQGVNWVYLLWALGFESVWAVILPIMLTEAIFPDRRKEPWLRPIGVVRAAIPMTAASIAAWYSWTHVFLPKFYPNYVYHPPVWALGGALVIIAGLLLAAWPKHPAPPPLEGTVPGPVFLGCLGFLVALPWFLIVVLAFSREALLPPLVPLLGGPVVAVLTIALLQYWSRCRNWGDPHRLALIAGAVTATLVGGIITLTLAHARLADRAGQVMANLVFLAGLTALARRSAGHRFT